MSHNFKPQIPFGKGGYEKREDFEVTARADLKAGLVMLEFGQPELWFGMTRDQALKLTGQLLEALKAIRTPS